MRVIASPIPDGSHGVRVWIHESSGPDEPESKADYDFACNLNRVSDTECYISQAIGDLSDEAAILIGVEAYRLGYRLLTFRRSAGGKATRWATYSHTDDGMDYYYVDLVKAMSAYEGRT